MSKPFRVSAEWLAYAHGPGADDDQPTAMELVALVAGEGGAVLVPADRRDLVAEIVSVAELYDGGSSVQDDDRLWMRAYPGQVIRRGRAWLQANPAPVSTSKGRGGARAGAGRKAGDPDLALSHKFSTRLNAAQADALEAIGGGAWLRAQLDALLLAGREPAR